MQEYVENILKGIDVPHAEFFKYVATRAKRKKVHVVFWIHHLLLARASINLMEGTADARNDLTDFLVPNSSKAPPYCEDLRGALELCNKMPPGKEKAAFKWVKERLELTLEKKEVVA